MRLRCAGVWLDTVAPYSEPVVTRRWGTGGGGVSEVTWLMSLPAGSLPACLTRGSLVELMSGASVVGRAVLGEPGRTEEDQAFTATGEYRLAESTLALTEMPTQVSTVIPDQAIDAAIARGTLPWSKPDSISNVAAAASTGQGLQYVNTLLDAVADNTGKRWWVTDDGRVQLSADPTEPKWLLAPGLLELGASDDDYASDLFARYVASGGGLQTITAGDGQASGKWGRREFGVDLTPLGAQTFAQAIARLNGLLAKGAARLKPVDRLEVNSQQLLTIGGQPAPLGLVRPGDMVRAPGRTPLSLNGGPYFDFVIGETTYDGGPTLSLAPVDLAARNLEDVLSVAPRTALTA